MIKFTAGLGFAFLSTFAGAHGLHTVSRKAYRLSDTPATVKQLGAVIAVRRNFPLIAKACEANFNPDHAACFVAYAASLATHLDYAFPLPQVTFEGGHEIRFEVDEHGYSILYEGPAKKPLEYLTKAIAVLASKGIRTATANVYRPSEAELVAHPYQEIFLGNVIGVRRRIEIRAADCAKQLVEKSCWVRVLGEDNPDHPGPEAGGEVPPLEYSFSIDEKVSVSLEDYYNQYLIQYDGSETAAPKILAKIETALAALKGDQPVLTLECRMFTLEPPWIAPKGYTDEKVSGATYFEVGMPVEFELCKKSLNEISQTCQAHFSGSKSPYEWDHPGGDEQKTVSVGTDGVFEIFGTYVPNNPYWLLKYTRAAGSTLTPLELVQKGIATLSQLGESILHGYGFQAGEPKP